MRIISPSLSPNTESEDVIEAVRVLLHPESWQQGSAIEKVEEWFRTYLDTPTVVSFDSGRSALLAILQAFGVRQGDEVLLQAFTCVAVPNSVRWAGATPVYVDIDDSFNIGPNDLAKKITKSAKAVIVQHTFGVPGQMDAIMALAKKYELIVIEDCAHSLGAMCYGKKVGTLGDAAFFSFGRDKVISSVWGGMATVSAQCKVKSAQKKLQAIQQKLLYPSHYWIFQQLLHPVAFAAILPTYNIVVGKVILETLKRMRLLSVPVYEEEKRGEQPTLLPRRYPNALAKLLVKQLAKLERYNDQRRCIARYYHEAFASRKDLRLPKWDKEAVYLRFPILRNDPARIKAEAKRDGILLGNWYHNVIDPGGVDVGAVGYKLGSCLRAEEVARHVINLPSLISKESANKVISALYAI
ncbi:aminotransferase class I/II-fold pyridoxal phosphate-dependent enzyme [Candidatus Gottesmanbacteria bacterium]|nr:aminotransferase class I/II-fold pyridoxal phosphate-dependent enzyme [Candidatus Gottesmanbacteria bacterium]